MYSFINQMIFDTGTVATSDVGFWSGLIESLFSLVQMILMIPYGWLSDAYGRKPVLIISLLGVGIATCLFGFSQQIWQMIAFRLLAGASAGTVVTIRTMISEISTKKTEARAFSLFAFSSNLGIFFGPLLGGVLSKPADSFPKLFGKNGFFKAYPYFLPPFAAGILSIICAISCFILLNETLPAHHDPSHKPPPRQSTLSLLRQPAILWALFVYTHVMLLGLANTAILPLLWFTPIELSGYGFSPLLISIFLGGAGVSQAIWLLAIFPKLTEKLGTWGLLRWCSIGWPFAMLGNIVANGLLRLGHPLAFWIFAPLLLVIGTGTSMSFTGIQLALNAASPSPAVLGTLNGIALSLMSGTRAFAPATFSSLFAFGVGHQILGGYLAMVILVILSVLHTIALWWERVASRKGGEEGDASCADGGVRVDSA